MVDFFPAEHRLHRTWALVDPRPLAKFFLEHGANIDGKRFDGWTPLHLAVHFHEYQMAEWLLNHGAKVWARDKEGNTPLHDAALYRKRKMIKLLLKYGANPQIRNKEGQSPQALAPEVDFKKE